jgi:tetratricopeptide (TPR) repeat protein
LTIDERVLGPDHPGVALDLRNLAGLYDDQHQYPRAQALLERSKRIDEKVLGPDHPRIATDLNNLALFYEEQGKYRDAEPLYRRALAISEKTLASNDFDTATVAENLAHTLHKLGRDAEAKALEEQAAKIRANPSPTTVEHQSGMGGKYPSCSILITHPSPGTSVGSTGMIAGTAQIPSTSHLWALAHKRSVNGWWPQGRGEVPVKNGQWREVGVVYGEERDQGEFEVAVVAVDEDTHRKLNKWVDTAPNKRFPPLRFPTTTGGCPIARVIVVKK